MAKLNMDCRDIAPLIPLEKIHSSRDSVCNARESFLIDKAMTLEPYALNRRDEFFVVRHFRLPFLNNFYCDILHLYNIVIPIINSVTSVNLKKPGMASEILL